MKLTGKPGTGKPHAGFDEAEAGNELIASTAPVLDPTDEGKLEIELAALHQLLYSTQHSLQVAVNDLLEIRPPEPVRPFEPLLADRNKG